MSANREQIGGDHYKKRTVSGQNLEHWDICWQLGFDQFQYCITKYVFRHKYKNGLEDLRKARHQLDKYIELLEQELPQAPLGTARYAEGLKELGREVGVRMSVPVAAFGEFDSGEPQGRGYVDQD